MADAIKSATAATGYPPVEWQIKAIGLRPDWYIALSSVLLFITTLAMLLRLYVRGVMLKSFGLDDATLVLAYLVFVAFACVYIAVGAQQKSEGVLKPFVQQVQYVLTAEMLYIFSAITLKVALATFFLRIVQARWQQLVLIFSVILFTLYMIAFALVALFQCGAIDNLLQYNEDRCLPWSTVLGPMTYLSAVLNAIVDFIMFFIQLLVICRLNMNKRDKFSVAFLMLLGLAGSIVSIVRIPLIGGLRVISDISYFSNILPISFCSEVETALGITALALAALRPLFRYIVDKSTSALSGGAAAGERGPECPTTTLGESSTGDTQKYIPTSSSSTTPPYADFSSLSKPSLASQCMSTTRVPSTRGRQGSRLGRRGLFSSSTQTTTSRATTSSSSDGPLVEKYNDTPYEAAGAGECEDQDEAHPKSDLVDFPTSIYAPAGRRHLRRYTSDDEEWLPMGSIRLEVTTTVSSSRI